MGRIVVLVIGTVALAALLTLQGMRTNSYALHLQADATPEPAGPVIIASEVLGQVLPVAVDQPELSLARVTIMPGAALPRHVHPGTEIGAVVQGELTYTVFSGQVELYRADDPAEDPYLIQPGETVVVRAGDVLVETAGAVHQARNDGDGPITIYLSSLFPEGAPRSSLVEATPAA
jgi:quercetin dioxygenase-like cupin family protein